MSRNFEKEYRELAQMEAPDLWDRIEAGIREKPIAEESFTGQAVAKGLVPPEKRKTSIIMILKKYQAVAAAVLCLVLIGPALLLMKQQGVKSEAVMEEAACEASEEAACEASEEAAWETPAEETPAEETPAEEAPAEMMADSAVVTAGGAEVEEALATVESAETEVFNQASSKLKDEYSAEKEAATYVLTNVKIRIGDSMEYADAQENRKPGVIYRCEVISYKGDELKEEEIISVFMPESSLVFEKDSCYEVDLVWQEKENYSYRVEFIYE